MIDIDVYSICMLIDRTDKKDQNNQSYLAEHMKMQHKQITFKELNYVLLRTYLVN